MRDLLFLNIVRNEVAYVLTKLKANMNERVARNTLEAKKQPHEKTNNGLMKKFCSNLTDYEKTYG